MGCFSKAATLVNFENWSPASAKLDEPPSFAPGSYYHLLFYLINNTFALCIFFPLTPFLIFWTICGNRMQIGSWRHWAPNKKQVNFRSEKTFRMSNCSFCCCCCGTLACLGTRGGPGYSFGTKAIHNANALGECHGKKKKNQQQPRGAENTINTRTGPDGMLMLVHITHTANSNKEIKSVGTVFIWVWHHTGCGLFLFLIAATKHT